ncbi:MULTISPECIES: GNAT family N-acetyltransferase [Cryobacterium]|uniref:GNAT family N-acetyltransferase n=1 Tax=Cryobacterium breve TaxID=1259258 RepID=A0ABY2IYG2_9MICO|nr:MULTISPECIES: GNAT family N-acetyltransferase [Cryobacterium]TFC96745.1 GNAT family N-acetyltransferase [Cryobacterium sp. TmT3-12]TFC97458.1 GNAT family N-acetyltransferase [Cryobacterium breve]
MPDIRIAQAGPEFAGDIARIHVAARDAYYLESPRLLGVPGQEWDYEPVWRDRLRSHEHTVMTASVAGQILGFAAMKATSLPDGARADAFELVGLYVDPHAWGRGIGSRLYEAFEAKWLAADSATAVLEVWNENDRAIRFYTSRGWQPDGHARPAREGTTFIRMLLSQLEPLEPSNDR